jgi:hypothetical protein
MKLIGGNIEFVDKSGLKKERFSIVNSPKIVKLLSSNIYTNKVRAVIREYSTNAFDAHKLAGIKELPLVHLPTSLDPYFSVRDYGNGLSEEGMKVFASFFDSDKTDSNDFVGCLGLGSCAAFSLVKSFMVISYHQGLRSEYLCYEDGEGYPNISKVHEERSDEPSGLHVIINVSVVAEGINGDKIFNEFRLEAAEVYKWFNVVPAFTKPIKINPPEFEKITDRTAINKDWKNSHKTYAVMGGIAYEVPTQYAVVGMDVRLDFEIGELEFDPGREKLSLDAQTLQNLQSRIQELTDELIERRKAYIFQDDNLLLQYIRYKQTPHKEKSCHPFYKQRFANEITSLIANVPNFEGFHINTSGKKRATPFREINDLDHIVMESNRCMTALRRHCKDNSESAFIVSSMCKYLPVWSKYMVDGSKFIEPREKTGRGKSDYIKRDMYARRLTKRSMSNISEKIDPTKTYMYLTTNEYTSQKYCEIIRAFGSSDFPYAFVVSQDFKHGPNAVHISEYVKKCVALPATITTEMEPFWSHLSIVDERFAIDSTKNLKLKKLAKTSGIDIPEDQTLIDLANKYKQKYPLLELVDCVYHDEEKELFKKVVTKL